MDIVAPHDGAAEEIRADGHVNGRLRYQVDGRLSEIKKSPGRNDRVQCQGWRIERCPSNTSETSKQEGLAMRCFKCEKHGHYALECPQKSTNKNEKSSRKKALLA